MLAESVASEGLVGESTSKMAPSHGCCWEVSVPYHVDLSIGLCECPYDMASPEQVIQEKE